MSKKYSKGFTLFELILYMAISVIVIGATSLILTNGVRIQNRSSAQAAVNEQINFVNQTIGRLMRYSSNIDAPADITTSTLKLRMQDSQKDPTCIYLDSGKVKIAEGPAADNPQNCTTTLMDLTSSQVIVDMLNFRKVSQYPGHDSVSIDIQISYNTLDPAAKVSQRLTSAIARVSAATFDSNLVPGSSYDYTVGLSGAPWKTIYMADGATSSPSYTFSNNSGLGLFRAGNNVLGISADGIARMIIDSSGNVGIGTTTPAVKLAVDGDIMLSTTTYRIKNVGVPVDNNDVANKGWVLANMAGGKTPKMQTFTSSGTWIRPTGVDMVWVSMVGGGGGGGGGANGICSGFSFEATPGGGGGAGQSFFHNPVSVSGNVAVTVGLAGSGGTIGSNGVNGTDSSFGSLIAKKGYKGNAGIIGMVGGAGGDSGGGGSSEGNGWGSTGGSGGNGNNCNNGNISSGGTSGGSGGVYGGSVNNGSGGSSAFGKGGNGEIYNPGANASGYGAGGGGGGIMSAGGNGSPGLVIVEWAE